MAQIDLLRAFAQPSVPRSKNWAIGGELRESLKRNAIDPPRAGRFTGRVGAAQSLLPGCFGWGMWEPLVRRPYLTIRKRSDANKFPGRCGVAAPGPYGAGSCPGTKSADKPSLYLYRRFRRMAPRRRTMLPIGSSTRGNATNEDAQRLGASNVTYLFVSRREIFRPVASDPCRI